MSYFLKSSTKLGQNSPCSLKLKTEKLDFMECYVFLQYSGRLDIHNNSCYMSNITAWR